LKKITKKENIRIEFIIDLTMNNKLKFKFISLASLDFFLRTYKQVKYQFINILPFNPNKEFLSITKMDN
jgi:hypothetical protein